jgi:hypothetical protein
MTNEMEKELEANLAQAVDAEVKPFTPRAVTTTASLTTQWDHLARIETELRNRVRRERLEIIAEYEKLVTETRTDFERREDDLITALHAKRDAALLQLRSNAAAKLREHDLLSQRMG